MRFAQYQNEQGNGKEANPIWGEMGCFSPQIIKMTSQQGATVLNNCAMADIGTNCLQIIGTFSFSSIDRYPIGVYNTDTPMGYLRNGG